MYNSKCRTEIDLLKDTAMVIACVGRRGRWEAGSVHSNPLCGVCGHLCL